MSITPQLILVPSIHRAKQIVHDLKSRLVQSFTLGNFIRVVYERHGSKCLIDQTKSKANLALLLEKVSHHNKEAIN